MIASRWVNRHIESFAARFPRAGRAACAVKAGIVRAVYFGGRVGEVIPFTLLGAFALPLLVWLAMTSGIARQDRIILSLAALSVVWIVLAVLLVSLAAICLWLRGPRLPEQPLTIEAGQPTFTGLSFSRFTWAAFFRLECQWAEPSGVHVELVAHHGRLAERTTAAERATATRVVRKIRISDPLGLASVTVRVTGRQRVTILPDPGQTDRQPTPVVLRTNDAVSQEMGPPEGDLAEIRRYVPGDPLKRILWKSFARTRQVLVRMPERAVAPTNKTNFYFVAAEGDEATAGVARAMIQHRSTDGEFQFAADGAQAPATATSEALELIARSRHYRAAAAAGLPTFMAAAQAAQAACVLFVPPKPGAWLAEVARQLAGRPDGCQVVIGFDGGHAPRSRIAKILTRPAARPPASQDELRSVYREMVRSGALVRVIDRRSGEPLDPAILEA
jgi:hypothetical protein